MAKKLSRNAPCPCGSGKKYKHCCIRKDFDWAQMDDGGIGRRVDLPRELVKELDGLRELQRLRLGREPEKLFEGGPPLEHLEHWTVEAMKKGGVEPALIFAFEKTDGLLLSTRNENKVPDSDIAQWEAAITEYEKTTGRKASRRRLNDDDCEAMMANGPAERQAPSLVEKLPIAPPFSKEEWRKHHVSDVMNDQVCFAYFQSCITDAIQSDRGRTYVNMFSMMAHFVDRRGEVHDYAKEAKKAMSREFSLGELERGLESLVLTCEPKSTIPNAAAAFEILAVVGDFMSHYSEAIGASDELSNVLERVHALALLAFVAAVNSELGIQPDVWKS